MLLLFFLHIIAGAPGDVMGEGVAFGMRRKGVGE